MSTAARKVPERVPGSPRPPRKATQPRATPAQLRAGRKLIAEMLEHNPMPSDDAIEAVLRSWKV